MRAPSRIVATIDPISIIVHQQRTQWLDELLEVVRAHVRRACSRVPLQHGLTAGLGWFKEVHTLRASIVGDLRAGPYSRASVVNLVLPLSRATAESRLFFFCLFVMFTLDQHVLHVHDKGAAVSTLLFFCTLFHLL